MLATETLYEFARGLTPEQFRKFRRNYIKLPVLEVSLEVSGNTNAYWLWETGRHKPSDNSIRKLIERFPEEFERYWRDLHDQKL